MKTTILALSLLLVAGPAEACHHYRYWHFRHPQRCGCASHAPIRPRVRIAEAKRPDPPPTAPRPTPTPPQESTRSLDAAPPRDPAIEALIREMTK